MREETMSLGNEVALVSGASRGIGRAIAIEHDNTSATVIGTATSSAGAENISGYLAEAGVQGLGMLLDVTDPVSVEQVMEAVQKQFGAPGILFIKDFIMRDNLLMMMKEEECYEIIDTNLSSVFRLSKDCLRGLMN